MTEPVEYSAAVAAGSNLSSSIDSDVELHMHSILELDSAHGNATYKPSLILLVLILYVVLV